MNTETPTYGQKFTPVRNLAYLLDQLYLAAQDRAALYWIDSDADVWAVEQGFDGDRPYVALNRSLFVERLKAVRDYNESPKPDTIDLQLLFVDLGDSCVVKVEKGAGDGPLILDVVGDTYAIGDGKGNLYTFHRSFAEIRAAIDALEGEKPVPRLERDEQYGFHFYRNHPFARLHHMHLDESDYQALSQLAGHDLPIYEPTKGEWTEVVRAGKQEGMDFRPDFSVWRYVRREA